MSENRKTFTPEGGNKAKNKRPHQVVTSSARTLSGFLNPTVTHNLKWDSGDRVIDGICDWFGGKRTPEASTEYHSFNEDPIDTDSFPYEIIIGIVVIAAYFMLLHNSSSSTVRHLFLVTLGIIIVSRMASNLFENLEISTLLNVWSSIPRTDEDVQMEEVFEPQGIDFEGTGFPTLILSLFTILSGHRAKKSLLEGLVNVTKISKTQTENVTTALISVSTKLHNFFNDLEYEDIAKFFYVERISDANIMRCQERIYTFVSHFNSGNPESMLTCQNVYHEHMKEVEKLMKSCEKGSFDYRVLIDCQTKLTTIFGKLQASKVSLSGPRVEPVGVLFKGEPAVMKGVLCQRIASVVAIATLPKEWIPSYQEDKRGFFYNIPNGKFWENYDGKVWVTFCDDIFQARDVAGSLESDALKVIDMINSAPFVLDMAEVSSKNNVFFRSAFVMATTNLRDWSMLQSVIDVGAVSRRFHLEVDVKINHKYMKDGAIDWQSLPLDTKNDSTKIPNDFWFLYLSTKVGSTVVEQKAVTLKELIQVIIARHISHVKHFNSNANMEEELVNELANELGYSFDNITPQGPEIKNFEKCRAYLESVDLTEYYFQYSLLCHRLNRLDLLTENFLLAFDRLFSNSDVPVHLLKSIAKPNKVVGYMSTVISEKITQDCDPFSGEYVGPPKSSNTTSPVENIKKNFQIFAGFVTKHWQIALIGSLISGLALKQLYDFFFTIIGNNPESVDNGRMGLRSRNNPRLIKLSSRKINTNINSQGALPANFEFGGLPNFRGITFGPKNNKTDVMAKIFNKYFFILYLVDHKYKDNSDFNAIRWGHLINLRGQIFMMPMHFILLLDAYVNGKDYEGSTMVLTTSNGSNRYSVDTAEFMRSFKTTESAADSDVCLVKLECSQKMSAGVLSFILKDNDIENLMRTTSFAGQILGSHHPEGLNTLSIRNSLTQVNRNSGSININAVWERSNNLIYQLSDVLMYKWDGSKGDCGSMLFSLDGNFENRSLCGMHVAGGDGYGFSVLLTQETCENLITDLFGTENSFLSEEQPSFLLDTSFEAQGSLQPIFSLQKEYIPMEPYKSEIRKSKLHSNLPPPFDRVNTLPAKISCWYNKEGELQDPLEKAFNKYGKISPDLDIDLVDRSIQSYENLFLQHNNLVRKARRIYTVKEVLHCFENINSICSSTSSGFPMSCRLEKDLKKEYYQACQNGDALAIESAYLRIASLVESTLQLYRQRIRPFFAYKQCGKDETRELEKVLMGKTRLFSACPFVLLLLFRMYFGSFISSFIECNILIGSAVGMNPYSSSWDTMARMLLKFSNRNDEKVIAAGDQGQFDTRQWTLIHNKILDMMNRFYPDATDEDTYIRTALFMEITNSRHVFRGLVYEWNSGLPSGNPITAILNTIYNNIVFRISWGYAGLEIEQFNDNCTLMVLGDDNIFSVKAVYRHIFNELTLPKYMSMCGMEYTTELKGKALTPFRSLNECEFLKRSFYLDRTLNRWIAPLRESAIAEMLNWTKKGKEGDQITLDNLCFALREFSLHGKDKFDFWKEHLVELRSTLFPFMKSHGDMPLDFRQTYVDVLKLEYYF